jgi:hypothetical protein
MTLIATEVLDYPVHAHFRARSFFANFLEDYQMPESQESNIHTI